MIVSFKIHDTLTFNRTKACRFFNLPVVFVQYELKTSNRDTFIQNLENYWGKCTWYANKQSWVNTTLHKLRIHDKLNIFRVLTDGNPQSQVSLQNLFTDKQVTVQSAKWYQVPKQSFGTNAFKQVVWIYCKQIVPNKLFGSQNCLKINEVEICPMIICYYSAELERSSPFAKVTCTYNNSRIGNKILFKLQKFASY